MPQQTFIAKDHELLALLSTNQNLLADTRVLMHENCYNLDEYLLIDGMADIKTDELEVVAIRHEDRQFVHIELKGVTGFGQRTQEIVVAPMGVDELKAAFHMYGRDEEFETLKPSLDTRLPADIADDADLIARIKGQLTEAAGEARTDKVAEILMRAARELHKLAA